LCIKHEWNVQLKNYVDSQSGNSCSAEIQKAVKSHAFLFSLETVIEWTKNPENSLTTLIARDEDNFRKKQYERYDELLDNLMDKTKKDKLDNGFEKMCGLKGCMLSGG